MDGTHITQGDEDAGMDIGIRMQPICRYHDLVTIAACSQSSFLLLGLVPPLILRISIVKTRQPGTRPLSPYARLDGMYL